MDLKQAYLLAQENCGIEAGDTVEVLRTAKGGEAGWADLWNPYMNT